MIQQDLQTPTVPKSTDFAVTLRQESTLEEIRKALPLSKKNGIDRITRIALTEFRKNDALQRCTHQSIIASIMQSCQLGLEIGSIAGQTYLVPYGNECTLQLGYRGMIELAYRSKLITCIQPNTVYENDEFSIEKGTEPRIIHKPNLSDQKGKVTGFYVVAHLTNGKFISHYMTVSEINAHRDKFSKSKNIWQNHYDAMALKTVMKMLFKWLPQSAEMIQAMEYEKEHEDKAAENSYVEMVNGDGEVYTTNADRAAAMLEME